MVGVQISQDSVEIARNFRKKQKTKATGPSPYVYWIWDSGDNRSRQIDPNGSSLDLTVRIEGKMNQE
jgi:hypothetical protein